MYQSIRSTGNSASRAVAIALYADTKRLPVGYSDLDRGGVLTKAIKRAEFSAAAGELSVLYPTGGAGKVERLYVLGLGNRKKFKAESLRTASARLVRAAWKAELKNIDLRLIPGAGKADADTIGRAAGDGIALANFHFDRFAGSAATSGASGGGGTAKKTKRLSLSVAIDSEARSAFKRALTVGESANLARRLAATPPNVANPRYLVDECRKMSRQVGIKCSIIDAKKAKQLKMGGLIAVGKAGSTPPAMIIMEWPGKTAAQSKKPPIMLVGKAITFDTGGYSLKPPSGMAGMKYDKCGGMAVIGAMQSIAKLKLPRRVIGIVAAAENMVDSGAYRPDDIITFCNGVTCEVTNTDAEGRLVLADALAYGCKTYKPEAVIDLATLTGGVVVALGSICAGMFCGDKKLRTRLFDAGDATGERLWNLPLWDEHRDLMRGHHSDIVNSSVKVSRECHPIQGAAFLSFFAAPNGDATKPGEISWAHLDIAGVADTNKDSPMIEKGPTGFGVRLLTRAVETW